MSEETQTTEPNATEDLGAQSDFIIDAASDEVLRLHLDQFEGPLEVLLYLIKSQEIDIFDIPLLKITEQFLRFLDLMEEENLEITGDFLVMAATLIQIKSRMLLPDDVDEDEDEEIDEGDPRLELVEKLLEYRRYRDITTSLGECAEAAADRFPRSAKPKIEVDPDEEEYLEVNLYDLLKAFRGMIRYLSQDMIQTVTAEESSVDDKIAVIETMLSEEGSAAWIDLFKTCRSRVEMVCCFLAILELCRMGRVRAHQHKNFGDIRLFPATPEPEPAAA